jgi:hypothetical protein
MHTLLPHRSDAEAQLAHAARELGRICDRLHETTSTARSLSSQTDWQARAATEFHEMAQRWAEQVARLASYAEDARAAAARARDRAAAETAFQTGLS